MKNTEKSVKIKIWTLLNYLSINMSTELSVLIKILLLKEERNELLACIQKS